MRCLRRSLLPPHRGQSTYKVSARDVLQLNLIGQMRHMQNVPVRDELRAGETPAEIWLAPPVHLPVHDDVLDAFFDVLRNLLHMLAQFLPYRG